LEYTKCDAVMIGRGALGNPEVFAEITNTKSPLSKYEIISKHIDILRKYYPESFINGHMRKHLLWYLKGYTGGSEIKNYICTEKDMEKVLLKIKEFLENYENN